MVPENALKNMNKLLLLSVAVTLQSCAVSVKEKGQEHWTNTKAYLKEDEKLYDHSKSGRLSSDPYYATDVADVEWAGYTIIPKGTEVWVKGIYRRSDIDIIDYPYARCRYNGVDYEHRLIEFPEGVIKYYPWTKTPSKK